MTERWVSPVEHDRTRPVVILCEWNLTGNDRTLRSNVLSPRSSESGHHLTDGAGELTIGIMRCTSNGSDMWHRSSDQTLGAVHLVRSTGASSQHVIGSSEEPNGSIRGGSLFKLLGRLKLTLLTIFIDIATL